MGKYLKNTIMPVEQIIKNDNGDGSTTVTVVTEAGNVAVGTYYDYQAQSTIDDIQESVTKEALDKD